MRARPAGAPVAAEAAPTRGRSGQRGPFVPRHAGAGAAAREGRIGRGVEPATVFSGAAHGVIMAALHRGAPSMAPRIAFALLLCSLWLVSARAQSPADDHAAPARAVV